MSGGRVIQARGAAGERPWAYSAFPVRVLATRRPSPRFVRLTLGGESLNRFAPWGVDQRIKLVLPMADGSFPDVGLLDEPTPHPSHWYTRWKALPEHERNVLRTYTPAAIRPEVGEIDVDVYLHRPAGPASAWADAARPGDALIVTGPDVRAGWTGYGIHWDPGTARRVLIVADETAYPAARNVLQSLPAGATADVVVECADPADDLLSAVATATPGVHVTRAVDAEQAVRRWGERADPRDLGDGTYCWLAGEATATARLRRHLVVDLGVPRERVSFLGYWRVGGALVG